MIARILMAISGRLPCRIISDAGVPYLERYYLCTALGARFYLHRFVGSDPDRGLHDHPWRWAYSFILLGWYYEQTRYGLRTVRWFNRLTGDTFHRVLLPSTNPLDESKVLPVWTLFCHQARRAKTWGFLRDASLESGCMVYVPFKYEKNDAGKDGEWWKTALPGNQTAGRQP
jgi:hypothetical protein